MVDGMFKYAPSDTDVMLTHPDNGFHCKKTTSFVITMMMAGVLVPSVFSTFEQTLNYE